MCMEELEFSLWVELIKARTGMVLPRERQSFLVTKLLARMRATGCQSFREYYRLVTQGAGAFLEWVEFVDRITTHETRFFRDPNALGLLRDVALPDVLQRAENLHVWSAGCATGEEAYTLAMLIEDVLSAAPERVRYAITATDISMPCLSTARAGRYHRERVKHVPPGFEHRFFTPRGTEEFEVIDELKRRVCFAQMNLLESGSKPIGAMDIIFCQKVLIYLEQKVRHMLLDRIVLHLKPGGYLILGIGEVTGWRNSAVQRVPGTDVLAFRSTASELD